jgi:hypothetical protein
MFLGHFVSPVRSFEISLGLVEICFCSPEICACSFALQLASRFCSVSMHLRFLSSSLNSTYNRTFSKSFSSAAGDPLPLST